LASRVYSVKMVADDLQECVKQILYLSGTDKKS
jgi:hypothetical protein